MNALLEIYIPLFLLVLLVFLWIRWAYKMMFVSQEDEETKAMKDVKEYREMVKKNPELEIGDEEVEKLYDANQESDVGGQE